MTRRRSNGEGTIFYSEAEGKWVADVSLPNGRRRRKRDKKQSVVRKWLQDQINAINAGVVITDNNVTVGVFLDRFIDDVVEPTRRPKTVDSYRYLVEKHIKPFLGGLKLAQVRPAHLQALYSMKLNDGLSKRTVQYIHAVIRRSFNEAVKWGLLARNPATGTSPPAPEKRAPNTLSVDQLKQFLEVVQGHPYYPIYLIAIGCGLRRGEILGLEKMDVDLDHGVLTVRQIVTVIRGTIVIGEPKSESSKRSVVMPGFVIDVLRSYVVGDGLIFTTSSGKPVGPRNLLRHFHANLERAGLPRIRFHDLRHSFATIQLKSGVHPKVVQEALGHSTISLTLDTYSHVTRTLQEDAAERMNQAFDL